METCLLKITVSHIFKIIFPKRNNDKMISSLFILNKILIILKYLNAKIQHISTSNFLIMRKQIPLLKYFLQQLKVNVTLFFKL